MEAASDSSPCRPTDVLIVQLLLLLLMWKVVLILLLNLCLSFDYVWVKGGFICLSCCSELHSYGESPSCVQEALPFQSRKSASVKLWTSGSKWASQLGLVLLSCWLSWLATSGRKTKSKALILLHLLLMLHYSGWVGPLALQGGTMNSWSKDLSRTINSCIHQVLLAMLSQ